MYLQPAVAPGCKDYRGTGRSITGAACPIGYRRISIESRSARILCWRTAGSEPYANEAPTFRRWGLVGISGQKLTDVQLTTAYCPVEVFSSSTLPSTVTRQVTDVPSVCAVTPAVMNDELLLTVSDHGALTPLSC